MNINQLCSLRFAALVGGTWLMAGTLLPELVAKEFVPYRGSGWGTPLVIESLPPTEEYPYGGLTGVFVESGQATHFGHYTVWWEFTGYFDFDEDEQVWVFLFGGRYTQTAADGSSVIGVVTAREVIPPDGPPWYFTGTIQITEGTGRFEGVSGAWEMVGESTGDYTYTTEGMIASVGSLQSRK